MSKTDSVKIVDLWAEEGGPAFPVHTEDSSYKGMSLRDYFAAKAMQAMVYGDSDSGRYRSPAEAQRTSEFAYLVADAMLKARES